ncbi:hypothetical protein D3C78_1157500 [compost metagenome]
MPAEHPVQLAQVQGAIQLIAAIVAGLDAGVGREVFQAAELAHQFLEDVLQADQSDHVAVLVHHYAEAALLLLEVDQLGQQRRALRYEVGVPAHRHQGLGAGRALGQQTRQLAQVEDAFDLVDVFAVERQAGVGGVLQLGEELLRRGVQVDALDLAAGNHDGADGDSLQRVGHRHRQARLRLDLHPVPAPGREPGDYRPGHQGDGYSEEQAGEQSMHGWVVRRGG